MIMPIPGILVTIVALIGASCKLDEYDPTYKSCSDHHRDNPYRRKNSEFHLIHLIGSDMKSIRTRISIIILRILIDHDCPDGFTLERLLGGRDREIRHERWFRSTIPNSAAIGAPRARSQDNQCSTLQKSSR
jgi:hypothetical protein